MSKIIDVLVPDIGNIESAEVVDINVEAGDEIEKEEALIALESDKATLDIPSPEAGVVEEILVEIGQIVNEGTLILKLSLQDAEEGQEAPQEKETAPPAEDTPEKPAEIPLESQEEEKITEPVPQPVSAPETNASTDVHAGPGIRKTARELGVDLSRVAGTGPKGRVLKDDVNRYVQVNLNAPQQADIPHKQITQLPDFSKFGDTETLPLSRIQNLSAEHLHQSWITIPHVTQFDEADITELEHFRKSEKGALEQEGIKLTPLPFVLKALVSALREFPRLNSSYDPAGRSLIIKHYYHFGVAVDTPGGLMVVVIKDVDKKTVKELALELMELSERAREGKTMPTDIEGHSFTISSLGGIGGTSFTPIVNPPDVAILGLSKAQLKPVYIDGEFQPRLILPISLSYDHRVIDGALGVKFTRYLCSILTDIRKSLL